MGKPETPGAAGNVSIVWSGTDTRWRHRQREEVLHTPAWQQVNPDKPRLLAISWPGGSGEMMDGPSRFTGPFGEPVPAKVTGGADRRPTKSLPVRDKGERFKSEPAGKGGAQFQGHRTSGYGILKNGQVVGRRTTEGVLYFEIQKVSKQLRRAHLRRFPPSVARW